MIVDCKYMVTPTLIYLLEMISAHSRNLLVILESNQDAFICFQAFTLAGSIFFVGCSSGGAVSRVVYNIAADNKDGAGTTFAKLPWIFRCRIFTFVESVHKKVNHCHQQLPWNKENQKLDWTGHKLLQTPAKIILWNTELMLWYAEAVEKKWILLKFVVFTLGVIRICSRELLSLGCTYRVDQKKLGSRKI